MRRDWLLQVHPTVGEPVGDGRRWISVPERPSSESHHFARVAYVLPMPPLRRQVQHHGGRDRHRRVPEVVIGALVGQRQPLLQILDGRDRLVIVFELLLESAQGLLLVIRVADLKTRAARFERVRREAGATADDIVYMTEFMHPRLEELAGTLPAALGRLIEAHPGPLRALLRKGRRVRTGTISWFLALYLISALRPIRRRTLRHAREVAHLEDWLSLAAANAPNNYDLAVEILGARRLVKGYSDTLARGMSKFDRVIGAVPLLAARQDGATWLRRLRQAALMDESGAALDGALKTIASL